MMEGGAIEIEKEGNVANCNFTNNEAFHGGAIFSSSSSVENCTFTNNRATGHYGGAIYLSSGSVKNCKFTHNSARDYGGAVNLQNGDVANCNFTNNAADNGGAIIINTGTVTNCNFKDNIGGDGGAVYFSWEGAVSNCIFTGNNATAGSAIYFEYGRTANTVSNSYLLNNRANAKELQVTKNEVNIIIVFTGNDNLLNAIYSPGDVSFSNVTYWGINGIDNTDNYAPSRSNREAGQNITIEIYDSDDKLAKNFTLVTDENGQVSFDYLQLSNGNYTYKIYHPQDCYYTYSEKTGEFSSDFGDFNRLQRYINNADPNSVFTLSHNCTFTIGKDENLIEGIVIDKQITINGNGYTMDANGKSRIFKITGNNVVLENITFKNAYSTYAGCAVYFSQSGRIADCNFTNNSGSTYGGAVYFGGNSNVANCNFINNTAAQRGGAILFNGDGNVVNSNFINNSASEYGGAVYFEDNGDLTNCTFVKNSASRGGAIFDGIAKITNCNFADNSASRGGAVHIYSGNVLSCNFTGNNASNGSAIYFHDASGATISHSVFLNNRADAEDLDVIQNGDNITIIFAGGNNLLNAIYSGNNVGVTVTNVTYWDANGINNTGSISRLLSVSNREAGQNITIRIIVDGGLVLNEVKVTDKNGEILLENVKLDGSYYIIVEHVSDSYYTEAEEIITNMKLYANVTNVTTHNRTVNITAKSNIPTDVIGGRLMFILPNGKIIDANYASNGAWWAVYKFDDYANYTVSASYVGLDNVTVSNATISITREDSEITLDKTVFDYGDSINVATVGAIGITAKIDGGDVEVVNNFTIPLSGLNSGTYNLTVTTKPDGDHNSVTETVIITINKDASTLSVDDIAFDYNAYGFTNVSFTGAYGVNASVVGQPNAVVKVNGTNITVSGLNAGTYTLTVTTIPDENHKSVTKNVTITVNKLKTELEGNPIISTYNVNKYLVITLKDVYGNPLIGNRVLVDLNGVKTYTTDKNGKIKIATGRLVPKTYIAKITFNGNDNYLKSTKNVKVTVKKAKSKIVAKKKTFKKAKKVKKYTITLKSGKTAIKKVQVTLKIKGKKIIKAKTNKKGKATFKIKKLTKKGTYKATIKFKGNKYYKAVTKKVKIKIK